ncbi:MAG: hypothetical protein JW751_11785, partial [Polyangiaceae bacterium]|nr:hypothetical protein [Polyangiaceae bacterium]
MKSGCLRTFQGTFGRLVAAKVLVAFVATTAAGPLQAAPRAESRGAVEGGLDRGALGALAAELASPPAGEPAPTSVAPAAETPAVAELPGLADIPRDVAALAKGSGEVSPQSIALPGGAGTSLGMGESFSAQLTTGTVSYSVPLALPTARGNAQPSLGLGYSSGSGFGIAGQGWSVGAPAISRQVDRGPPSYDDRADWHPEQDRFLLGGTELVPICTVTSGACSGARAGEVMPIWAGGWQYFRARVEGSFTRVFWSPDHRTWRVQSKEGVTLELGVPLDASDYELGLEANPDEPTEIYRWCLVRQYDSHGDVNGTGVPAPVNVVVYRYEQDGGVAYLSDLFDTPPAADPTTAPLSSYAHHTRLVYETRPDQLTTYRAGWAQEHRRRLTRVDSASKPFTGAVTSSRELVRRYHLAYDGTLHASLLESVQMEGRCSSVIAEGANGSLPDTDCPRLPPMTFAYQRVDSAEEPLQDSNGLEYEPFAAEVVTTANSPPHSVDEDQTALADLTADGLADVLVTSAFRFDGGHGLFEGNGAPGAPSFAEAVTMPILDVEAVDGNILKLDNANVNALDYDADGRLDLLHMPREKTYEVFSTERRDGIWVWAGHAVTTADEQDAKIDFTQDAADTRVVDVNADGLVDIVVTTPTEVETFFSLGRYPGGEGRFGQATWTGPSTAELSTEPVRHCAPWSATPARFSDGELQLADLNGDGLLDLARVRSGQILYWPGRGNGFWGTGDRADCPGSSFGQDRHLEMANAPAFGFVAPGSLQLADVNGDGLADLVEARADAVDLYLNENGTAWTDRHVLSEVPFKANGTDPVRILDFDGSGTPDLVWGVGYEYQHLDLTGGRVPYLLVGTDNGLGKTTTIEYAPSTRLMVEAEAADQPWTSKSPVVVPVVTRTTARDHLDAIGRTEGVYVTEYRYRDPVFDGRQREFRGFRQAEVRALGDASHPTSLERSTFLLGECPATPTSADVCVSGERWQDHWREGLKGLPSVVEVLDEAGRYLSTSHVTYELRELYAGRDGRRVTVPLAIATDGFAHDTASFDGAETALTLDDVELALSDLSLTESGTVLRRASTGTVRTRSEIQYDDFGHVTASVKRGCTEGCPSGTDEAITTVSEFARPAEDDSGWLFRETRSYVTGSVHTGRRSEIRHVYDTAGDRLESYATLSGTEALRRHHEAGAATAPAPTGASGGTTGPIELAAGSVVRDEFGQVVSARGPNGRCSAIERDPLFAELPVEDTVYAGALGGNGCGQSAFTTTAAYDRGTQRLTDSTDARSQPAHFDYDEFGRLVARTFADPAVPYTLAPYPSDTTEYLLPSEPAVTPYSLVVSRVQDGPSVSSTSYREGYAYLDGFGRTIVSLGQADPSAGDGGDWVAGGAVERGARGEVSQAYVPWFWSGNPASGPPAVPSGTAHTTVLRDAFGRVTDGYGLDGGLEQHAAYHAASIDQYDAEDLAPGPHFGTHSTVYADGHGRGARAITRVHAGSAIEEHTTLNEYLPTGQLERVILRRSGSADVTRWMRYDSLGRLVLNVEPNTSPNFDPSLAATGVEAWRYAYNDAGQLVGTSDGRGCGVNYSYDAGGRLTSEDYSPCTAQQQAYSAPNLSTGVGLEAAYRYDVVDPDAPTIQDAAGTPLSPEPLNYWGRLASATDRATKTVVKYDARGRTTAAAVRVAEPGNPDSNPTARFAPRWYLVETDFDALDRPTRATTGATVPELLGADGASAVTPHYSQRGVVTSVDGSYGSLLRARELDAEGKLTRSVFGDAAYTERAFDYDAKHRLHRAQTYRSVPGHWSDPPAGYTAPTSTSGGSQPPTAQLSLEDVELAYDRVGNITSITDFRIPDEWPDSAKPVTRTFEYDDQYRVIHTSYQHAGDDAWTSPFAAELADTTLQPRPSPHVSFTDRVHDQTWTYDFLGNLATNQDDANGFADRSLGTQTHGTATAGPHQLRTASNRSTGSTRQGDLATRYDAAGNLTDLVIKRDGPCLPSTASCWPRFRYEWDELGRLSRARRWDLTGAERTNNATPTSSLPARTANVDLRHRYTAGGDRVLKTATSQAGTQRHTVYVFPTLELRSTSYTSGEYGMTTATTQVRLFAPGVAARVVYSPEDLPTLTSGHQHVLLELGDHLGSASIVLDQETGELAEHRSYQAYGETDSDYRPDRWGELREPYGFTGKEADIEVGLVYFGARYYSPALERWVSADPVTIHDAQGEPNPYSY